MSLRSRIKPVLLLLGDIVALYAALFATLALRYGNDFYDQFLNVHAAPFTIVFVPWLLIFYIAGLYDLRRLRNNLDFFKTLALSLIANAMVAALLFYLLPSFGIAPKTNLFVFLILFAVIELYWRRIFNRVTESGDAPNRVLLIGNGPTAAEVEKGIKENPQFGYAVVARIGEPPGRPVGGVTGILVRKGREACPEELVVGSDMERSVRVFGP